MESLVWIVSIAASGGLKGFFSCQRWIWSCVTGLGRLGGDRKLFLVGGGFGHIMRMGRVGGRQGIFVWLLVNLVYRQSVTCGCERNFWGDGFRS